MPSGNVRKCLLEGDIDTVRETVYGAKLDLYNFLCEFYTECDVKGVVLHEDIRKFIIEYVLWHRLNYASKNAIPSESDNPGNGGRREKLCIDLLKEYKDQNLSPIEVMTFLKTLVKVMRPLIYDKTASRLPWAKLQFVICVFIATKTHQTRLPDWLMDNYYQLMVTEEFVAKLFRLLLSRLEGDGQETVDWSELDDVYNISKLYYLVLKIFYYYETLFGEVNQFNAKNKRKRCLQTIGECHFQLLKLNYDDFEDSSYISQQMTMFATILVEERHKLAHFHQISNIKMNLEKLGLWILELTQIVRSKIEERALKEFETLLEHSTDKLLERINQLTFTNLSSIFCKNFNSLNLSILDILNKENYHINSAGFDIGIKLMNIFKLPKYENEPFFNFIKKLKKNSPVLKDGTSNIKLSKKNIIDQLKQISPPPFVTIKTLMDLFLSLIPASKNKQELANLMNKINTDYVMEKRKNADDEEFIQNILMTIDKGFDNQNDKTKFAKEVSKLMMERAEFFEMKIFKNPNAEKPQRRRNNAIQNILDNKYENKSNYEIAKEFLKQIKWKNNIDFVIRNISREILIDRSTYNKDVKEVEVLDSSELVIKRNGKFTFDFNFLDFDCPIPVGRNMRNYIAHGDICIDVLCPDMQIVVEENYYYFHQHHNQLNRLFGFLQPDNFELVWENFRKQLQWARETWEVLNWNNDINVLRKYETDPMAFRVRDSAGLTVIHYSLKDVRQNNQFLMFLMEEIKKTNKPNILFNKIIKSHKTLNSYQYNYKREILDNNSISFYINKLFKEDMALTLAQILCFNNPDIEVFKSVFSKIKQKYLVNAESSEEINQEASLLQIAVVQNQTEIVKYLLSRDSFTIKNSSNIALTALKCAIMNGNVEMASILFEHGDKVSHESMINKLNKLGVFSNAKGDESPFVWALAYGDPDMLSLLKSHGVRLDTNHTFDIQREIQMNNDPEVWSCILNSYCETMIDFEMFLHIACINEKFDIVKTIIDNKPLDLRVVKETILMSCYNLKSPEVIEYLLKKGAVLKLEHLKLICVFASIEVVEYLNTNGYIKNFSGMDLIGRNKEIVQNLLHANCEIDWKAVDFLPLEFIIEQNPPQDFLKQQIMKFLMLSSSKNKSQLVKNLNEKGIRFPLYVLEYAATELRLEKCNWLKECEFEETIVEWNKLLVTGVESDHYLLARIALRRGADISLCLSKLSLLDYYIEKNEGKVTEMMKLLSEFKCPTRFGIDFSNFTVQDQLLFGYLTKNKDMIKYAAYKASWSYKYSNFRDGTILHILYHYGISLEIDEHDSSHKNLDNCTASDLCVLNNPLRPLPSNFDEIAPFQRLIAGILRSNFEIMEDALESGAHINSVLDHYNSFSPLHVAVREDLTNVVEYLLSRGANPYHKNSYKDYPILTSIRKYDNGSVVEHLIRNMTTKYLDPVIRVVARRKRKNVLKTLLGLKQHHLKTITDFELALDRGFDINSVPNMYRETYLHIASYNSDFELVKFLLENGAKPLVKNCFNEFPIDVAVVKDDSSTVELLLKKNLKSYNLKRLLELAFENNSSKSARILLENGAPTDDDLFQYPCRMENNSGLELAYLLFEFDEFCYKLCVYFFEALGNSNYILAESMLLEAYRRSNIHLYDYDDFEMALKEGTNFNRDPELDFQLYNKIPYLHYATLCCESNVVELLLKNGAYRFTTDLLKRFPINYAIRLDDVEKVELLFEGQPFEFIEYDTDLGTTYNLRNLILFAFEKNSVKSVKYLIKKGFNQIKNKPQIIEDMFKKACQFESNKGLEMVKYFLEINLMTFDLYNFGYLSRRCNNFELADFLMSVIKKRNGNDLSLEDRASTIILRK